MANRYAVNVRSKLVTSQTRFRFGAADDATAANIVTLVRDNMAMYYSSTRKYIQYNTTNRGDMHTEGAPRSLKVEMVTPGGLWQTYRLRNIQDGADLNAIKAAFVAATLAMPNGTALAWSRGALFGDNKWSLEAIPAEKGEV